MNPVREVKGGYIYSTPKKSLQNHPQGISNGVKRFFLSLLRQQVFTFFLLILIASGLTTYFFPASLKPSAQAELGDNLRCHTGKASPGLRQAQLSQADKLKLVISFRSQPTAEQVAAYAAKGVILYPDSWLFDYLIGESSYQPLCDILSDPAVTYVDLANL
ncbi:MAG: hypothetical protein V1846_05120 [Candidatus Komeilibacteria bacterium]